jgi:UDP-GlcNAc:undecaprenyl-phosphate GlcNAc-1-phosphate transferase
MLVVFTLIFSFFISLSIIPSLIKIAKSKNLLDSPDERKIHSSPIPSLGGIAIYSGFALALCFFWPESGNLKDFQSIISASLVIFLLGLKDDLVGTSPKKKFAGEILACSILIFKQDLIIKSFHTLFGLGDISGIPAIALTFLTVILIINAYNLIDGIDGLGASLGILSLSLFGLFFHHTGYIEYAIVASALIGSLLGFLIHNWHPASIFMGDTGSLLVGLINAMFALKFMEVVALVPQNGFFSVNSCPVAAMAIIFVPLLDAVRVFSIRLMKGKSPFAAEKNHIHHMLLSLGLNHSSVTIILVSLNLFVAYIAWTFTNHSPTRVFIAMTLSGLLLSALIYFKALRKSKIKSRVSNNHIIQEI